jgi:hypothetical protein
MKKLLVLVLIIFAKSAFAQKDTVGLNIPFANNTVVYERVVEVPNAPKNMLFGNAGLWLAETRPYIADTQLQLEDPVLSRVVGRVNYSITESSKFFLSTFYDTYICNFTLQIDCKDNKYRIRIYNIQDVAGTAYTPIDELMLAIINSKSYTLPNGAVLKATDLQNRFKMLNIVVSNVIADIAKSMTVDNSF